MVHTSNIALGRPSQEEFCGFKASLVYMTNSRPIIYSETLPPKVGRGMSGRGAIEIKDLVGKRCWQGKLELGTAYSCTRNKANLNLRS